MKGILRLMRWAWLFMRTGKTRKERWMSRREIQGFLRNSYALNNIGVTQVRESKSEVK